MPYLIPAERIAVFFSPKAAGSSIRGFMFELENGHPYVPYRVQGTVQTANDLVRNAHFGKVKHERITDYRRFAVVRDPVRRLISAYSNRVVHYRELSERKAGKELDKAGLAPDPDIDTFMANVKGYARCSVSIRRHVRLQEDFLGKDAGYYERIFQVERLDSFRDHMNGIFGTSANIPREQTGGPKYDFAELAPETQQAVVRYVAGSAIFHWVPAYREKYAALMT